MRRWNACVGILLLLLLIIHLLSGAFQMMGFISGGQTWRKILSWCMLVLLAVHMIFGIALTVKSLKTSKKGSLYLKQNLRFWLARISGLAMIAFVACHVIFFSKDEGENFRLTYFGAAQLVISLLLVAALIVHVVTNMRALIVSMGAESLRKFVRDLIIVSIVVLIFGGVAFWVYYLRWNVLWR